MASGGHANAGISTQFYYHSCLIENKSGAPLQMHLPKWFQKVMDPSNQMAPVYSLRFDGKRIFDVF
jgi:hypothetical protein